MDIIFKMIKRNIISYEDGYWFYQSLADLDLNKTYKEYVYHNLDTSFRKHILESIERYASLVGDDDPNYHRYYYCVNSCINLYLDGIVDALEDLSNTMEEFISKYDELEYMIR